MDTHTEEVATVDQFRTLARRPIRLRLPESGLVVELRKIHIAELAAQGLIPDQLTGMVMSEMGVEAPPAKSPGDFAGPLVSCVNAVCCAVLAKPLMRRAEDVEDSAAALTPEDVPWADREYLFRVACRQEEVHDLSRFPGEPAPGLPGAPDGDGLLDEAERDSRSVAG